MAPAAALQLVADPGSDASRQLSWVILALVLLAILLSVATVVFWRLTRPGPRTTTATDSAQDWIVTDESSASSTDPGTAG